jgi:uncharacterized protein YcfL
MRLNLIACVVLSTLMIGGCSAAQPLVMRSVQTVCVNSAVLAETLAKYGERPALTMTNNREIAGQVESFATVLFVNYDTKSWTMAEQVKEDLYCVIGMGDHLSPYRSKDFF